ncbi:MAG TPA: glycoside hydrolase family 18 protein [Verrucomicrobiae bacterium]|jgi:chitinase|nr:glycoside hydrolase family 18 protein [Verrucomicrobiae bacterium]
MRGWRIFLVWLLAWVLSSSARADLWVTGYYPGYESGAMAPSNIDFTTITHVIHFSLVPESNGGVNNTANSLSESAAAKLVGLAHAAGRQALVCIGGAGTESNFLGATSEANLGFFVTNITGFMSSNNYDGVDLDWEPFNSADTEQYTNLVNGLRAALNKFATHKLLTVAAPAYPESGDSPTAEFAMLASVQGQFDQINIMTYDLSGPYEGWVTWYNSPIYDGGYTFPSVPTKLVPSINGAVNNFVSNGIKPGKLGIGLPFYGYNWTGGPGVTQARQSWPPTNVPTVTTPTYATIMNSYYQSNIYHWDNVAQAACLGITNTPSSGDMFISYDDTHACEAKVSYARNLHLGGLMIWELSQDYFSSEPAGQRTPLVAALKQSLATPSISAMELNGGVISFSFSSLPLGLYSVEWTTNLAAPSWNILSNNVAGTGTNVVINVPAGAAQTERFYRIQTPP